MKNILLIVKNRSKQMAQFVNGTIVLHRSRCDLPYSRHRIGRKFGNMGAKIRFIPKFF